MSSVEDSELKIRRKKSLIASVIENVMPFSAAFVLKDMNPKLII